MKQTFIRRQTIQCQTLYQKWKLTESKFQVQSTSNSFYNLFKDASLWVLPICSHFFYTSYLTPPCKPTLAPTPYYYYFHLNQYISSFTLPTQDTVVPTWVLLLPHFVTLPKSSSIKFSKKAPNNLTDTLCQEVEIDPCPHWLGLTHLNRQF